MSEKHLYSYCVVSMVNGDYKVDWLEAETAKTAADEAQKKRGAAAVIVSVWKEVYNW